jgi:transcriptional regulator with XRE-family HTH domain
MPNESGNHTARLTGHALRNAHLRERALARAVTAPPLARAAVKIRAEILGMTRLEFARRSGIRRGTLRDLELGVHTPTRRILQQFVSFCQKCRVHPEHLEEICRIYVGPSDTLERFIARLELRAGSPRELARRVGISAATLWEYRRGNFPMPLALLRKLCTAVQEDFAPAQALWHRAERQRLLDRGYPKPLAEFWVLCARAGFVERYLSKLDVTMASLRRLRYLELPGWRDIEPAARALCQNDDELRRLRKLWVSAAETPQGRPVEGFGPCVQQLRKRQGITRRELADLFGIGGKKPARIIKYIEENGFYSAQAYPAGLVAVLVGESMERRRLMELWRARRSWFHRRHRPETRVDLRLTRELYGFELKDMEPILGYTSLEYQRIERGASLLQESALARIQLAIEQAGQRRVEGLLQRRRLRETERLAWQAPTSVAAMLSLLAKRDGGMIPLTRSLKKAGLKGLWTGKLRAILLEKEVPPWHVLKQIAAACGVRELSEVHRDWTKRYRDQAQGRWNSPLSVELRLLIAEVAPTLRSFSPRLGFNYSVLVRDLQRIDRDEPVRWFHVERILRAAGLQVDDERWRQVRALWSTAAERKKRAALNGRSLHSWRLG